MKGLFVVPLVFAGAFFAKQARACPAPPVSNVKMVDSAQVIVRAIALDYAVFCSDPTLRTTGTPDSKVRFRILEAVRGAEMPELILPGYVVDRDDFNDRPVPYDFIRPGGCHGSFFANSCLQGARFFLLLKKGDAGKLTVERSTLAPVNEQLRSEKDSWLLWVRRQARAATDRRL